jgi:hypothetical protein
VPGHTLLECLRHLRPEVRDHSLVGWVLEPGIDVLLRLLALLLLLLHPLVFLLEHLRGFSAGHFLQRFRVARQSGDFALLVLHPRLHLLLFSRTELREQLGAHLLEDGRPVGFGQGLVRELPPRLQRLEVAVFGVLRIPDGQVRALGVFLLALPLPDSVGVDSFELAVLVLEALQLLLLALEVGLQILVPFGPVDRLGLARCRGRQRRVVAVRASIGWGSVALLAGRGCIRVISRLGLQNGVGRSLLSLGITGRVVGGAGLQAIVR